MLIHRAIGQIFAALLLVFLPAAAATTTAAVPESENSHDDSIPATPATIRQIQFMLLSLGFDPGPIDGLAETRTNRAVHQFEVQNGLPTADLVAGGQISSVLLDLLRKQAAAKLGGAAPAPAPPSAPVESAVPPAAPAAASPTPAEPPPDPFASCTFDPNDFLIGAKQYTPQTFLDEFGGSVDRAVPDLRKRLDEARDLAGKIGGAALLEVQRQARVLAYFECRQRIEAASAAPK
jgi:peptidoglycan hydrolase-like protein with peptidoglycan-binding domain